MVEIDGSFGEGGGQVLRSSLTLALLTQTPFRIRNIRARRKTPGLRAQHLASVRAAVEVGKARVSGDEPGSQELTFEPTGLHPGEYRFEIGTAGACSLVLQTIFLPLTRVDSGSRVEIIGGTHVAWSPTFEYIDEVWLAFMRSLGYLADVELKQAGYYPKGGGRIIAVIQPNGVPHAFETQKPASARDLGGISLSSNLPDHVAGRQRKHMQDRLKGSGVSVEISVKRPPSPGRGSAVFIGSMIKPPTFGFSALGDRGKRAEQVADEAINMLFKFLETEAVLDRFLADQVLIPLALAPARSRFTTEIVTGHLQTNAEIVRKFLEVQITISDKVGDRPATVEIAP